MNSQVLGENTSATEVTNISSHGFWLLSRSGEAFLPFEEFPWFKNALVAHIVNVEEPRPGHYYWPDLDIDLSDEIISNPERYPLKAASAT